MAYADPIYRLLPKAAEPPTQMYPGEEKGLEINSCKQDINIDFEENLSHQEGMISEIYQVPDKSYFLEYLARFIIV